MMIRLRCNPSATLPPLLTTYAVKAAVREQALCLRRLRDIAAVVEAAVVMMCHQLHPLSVLQAEFHRWSVLKIKDMCTKILFVLPEHKCYQALCGMMVLTS